MKKIIENVMFLILTYTFVLVLGFGFLLLQLVGRIRVINRCHLSSANSERGTLILSNHISILEGVLLPLLYFPHFLVRPFKYFPWSTPDRERFYAWYLFWLRPLRIIAIDRSSKSINRNKVAVQKIIQRLKKGETVIIFAEGGRTAKQDEKKVSAKGKEIGVLKSGIQKIINACECRIVPVWLEGTDGVMPIGSTLPRFWRNVITFRIGEPIYERVKMTELEDALLKLADET